MDQRELIQQQVREFDVQISLLQDEIAAIESGGVTDTVAYEQKRSSLADIISKREAKQRELNEVDGAGQAAANALFSEFDNITVDDMTFSLRDLCVSEGHYQFLSQWLQMREGNKAQEHAAIVSSYKSQEESFKAEIAALKEENTSLEFHRRRAIELEDKLADTESRKEAAADQLDEANGEIERLKEDKERLVQDNESLRKQLEAKQVNKLGGAIDTAEFKRQAAELHKLKPAITNKRWKNELVKNMYLAELVESGETIEIGYLNINQYREVSAEEAGRFRAEQAAREAEEARLSAIIPDTPLVTYEPPPSVTEQNAEVPTYPADGEVANEASAAELEKRLSNIESRLAYLEQSSRSVA